MTLRYLDWAFLKDFNTKTLYCIKAKLLLNHTSVIKEIAKDIYKASLYKN
jgi:hypothetical protein